MTYQKQTMKHVLTTALCLSVLMHVPVTDSTSYTPPPAMSILNRTVDK